MNEQPVITVGASLAGINTFGFQKQSKRTSSFVRPAVDESAHARKPVALPSAKSDSSGRTIAVIENSPVKQLALLSRDDNSSQLVNFPYALVAFVALGGGLLGAGWGMVIGSVGLAVTSFLVTLIGVSFYGCSLFDE